MINNKHVPGGRAFNQEPRRSASATAANASQRKLHKISSKALASLMSAAILRTFLSHNKALAACL